MPRRPQITLMQLTYFVEAANHLSMSAAADELRVAQSAVSASIAQLETHVGAQLFLRLRSKGLVLTAAGESLLRDSTVILAQLDEALESARGVETQVRGVVRLACFVTLAPFVLPGLLSVLGERFPKLILDVTEVDADGVRSELRRGAAELALSYGFSVGTDLTSETVAVARPYAVLPAQHPLAARGTVHLRELGLEKLILLDLPHSRDYFLNLLGSVGIEPNIRYRSTSYETVRALVARGHGYSILNQRPVPSETYDGGQVAVVEIADEVASLPIVISTVTSMRSTARARAVADCIREILA
ncbi:LysR family transcriptional regulator [Cryobacterium sp.]|jgi:DNA-binding transcriptional LysR family regulator|uniref:LysR family transcriptional regulator n=1 Tax=Cryobacterium sp. TaxID=1926290 RepID=UPI002631EF92|nr:LysR family transcriptional regulator [Cryobacterium sp.]MCU1444505.1 putative HTH-type transcriptional regulator yvbU [Cryobacterium sp.]